MNAEGRKTKMKDSLMLNDIFELICVFGFSEQLAILLCSVLNYNVSWGLVVILLFYNLIEDNTSNLLHRYVFVEHSLPNVFFG